MRCGRTHRAPPNACVCSGACRRGSPARPPSRRCSRARRVCRACFAIRTSSRLRHRCHRRDSLPGSGIPGRRDSRPRGRAPAAEAAADPGGGGRLRGARGGSCPGPRLRQCRRDRSAARLAHGNLRPDNIAILRTGRVKLIDFGAARVVSFVRRGGPVDSLRRAERFYLAPERLAGAPVDARGDLFSLGALLWELLCSRPLFPTVDGIFEAPIPPPSRLRPEIPPHLDALVLGLLERDATRRHLSADEARRTLAALLPSPTAAERNLAVISCDDRHVKSSGLFPAAVPGPQPRKPAGQAAITRVVPALGAMFQQNGQPRAGALPGHPHQKSVRPVSELPRVREGRAAGRKSHGISHPAPVIRLSAGRSRMAAIRDRRRGLAFRLVQIALISLLPLASALVGNDLRVAELPAPQRAPRSVLIQPLTTAPGTLDPSRFAKAKKVRRPRAGRRALQHKIVARPPVASRECRGCVDPLTAKMRRQGDTPAQAGGVEQEIVAFGSGRDSLGSFRWDSLVDRRPSGQHPVPRASGRDPASNSIAFTLKLEDSGLCFRDQQSAAPPFSSSARTAAAPWLGNRQQEQV